MTNKDFMQSLSYLRGLLFNCPFSGNQMMVAAECIRVIDVTMAQLNEQNMDKCADDHHPNKE